MASKQNRKLADEIPSLRSKELEGRFQFIKDGILRTNTALALQHIIVLIAIIDREKADKTTIASSIYKDMVVHYATIVESCIHYCLRRYIEEGRTKESRIMPKEWKVEESRMLYQISKKRRVCGILEYEKAERLTKQTNFIVINRTSKKAGILTKKLFQKAEMLRETRNNIHLAGLRTVDSFQKSDAQKASENMAQIVERVEKKLNEL